MRVMTRALTKACPERYHRGVFGGSWGYGIDFENEVFRMFPYYWGDCTCGYEQRWADKERTWTIENPHTQDCYQTELKARMETYDRRSGYTVTELAAFGDGVSLLGGFNTSTQEGGIFTSTVMTPRTDAAMDAWRSAHDLRREFEESLFTELCAKYRKQRLGCAIHCTCGRDEKWRQFASTDDHDPLCPTVVPNFRHKASGTTIEWYKYIGRDMEIDAPAGFDWRGCVRECLASVRPQVQLSEHI